MIHLFYASFMKIILCLVLIETEYFSYILLSHHSFYLKNIVFFELLHLCFITYFNLSLVVIIFYYYLYLVIKLGNSFSVINLMFHLFYCVLSFRWWYYHVSYFYISLIIHNTFSLLFYLLMNQ
jgi:hypothetical protein